MADYGNFLGALEYLRDEFPSFVAEHNAVVKRMGELEDENRRLKEAFREVEKAACSPVRIKKLCWSVLGEGK